MKSFGKIANAAIFSFALFASCAQAQEHFSVRDSWTPSGLQAGWNWALEKGLFAKRGVTIDYQDGNGSSTTVQLVGTGQVDVGYTDVSVMAIARGKGLPVISIGGMIQKTSLGVFVPKGSGLKTPKDLEGKEILYTATSFEGPFMDTFFRNGGTSRDKINLVSVDAAAKIPSYAAGRGDGMVTSIPFGSPYLVKTRPSDFILFADYGLALPSYGLVVREDTLKTRAPALKKLVAAYYEAWSQIIAGGEPAYAEAADIIIKRRPDAKLDRDALIMSIREHIKYFHTANTVAMPLGAQSAEDWKSTIKSLEAAKLVPAGTKPSDYFTNDLIPAAH
jgi:NitT/TauT family transport system substrate-binding protein